MVEKMMYDDDWSSQSLECKEPCERCSVMATLVYVRRMFVCSLCREQVLKEWADEITKK